MMTKVGVDLSPFWTSVSFLSKWRRLVSGPSKFLEGSLFCANANNPDNLTFSFEVILLRAHTGGMSGSWSTLILILWEKRGRKFSGFMTSHTMYQRPWQFSWLSANFLCGFHLPASSVCLEASVQPQETSLPNRRERNAAVKLLRTGCSNNAEVSALIIWQALKLGFIGTPFPSPRIKN